MVGLRLQSSLVLAMPVLLGAVTQFTQDSAMSGGQMMVGACASCTVIVWLTVPEWLPAQSTACQVRVSVKLPAQLPCMVTSLTRLTVAVPQLSLAVGAVNTGVLGH